MNWNRPRCHCQRFRNAAAFHLCSCLAIQSEVEEDHRPCSQREACEDWAYGEGAAHLVRIAVASADLEAHNVHTAAAEGSNPPQRDEEEDEDAIADADGGQLAMDDRPAEEVPSCRLVQLRAGASLLDQVLGQEQHCLHRCWGHHQRQCQCQRPCSCCSASESEPVERQYETLRYHLTIWTPMRTWTGRSHLC